MSHISPLGRAHPRLRLCALLTCFFLPAVASAEVPSTWAVTGALSAKGGGPVADGDYAVHFSLYDGKTNAKPAWNEATTVQVIGGRFDWTLGAIKPIAAATLAGMKEAWLGAKVGIDPELPRQRLHAVGFATLAAQASALSCSGCVGEGQVLDGSIGAAKVGFPFAGSKTKGGPATVAADLECTGCVSFSELKIDGDLDLGGNALKAAKVVATSVAAGTVQATSFVGDGSKISGIKVPAGLCSKKGEVVKGVGLDGGLVCAPAVTADSLPADGLDAVSNGLLSGKFIDVRASATTPKAIPDDNPTGMGDEIDFPDLGLAQKVLVHVKLSNSDISGLSVELFDPNNGKYVLHNNTGAGKTLDSTWPAPTKLVSGDLGSWIGQNPKGKWRLKILDSKKLTGTTDGALEAWSLEVQTLSDTKLRATGDLLVAGDLNGAKRARFVNSIQIGDDSAKCTADTAGTIRWTGKSFQGCDGKVWMRFLRGPSGKTADDAIANCKALKDGDVQVTDGNYWIDPDGKFGPIKPTLTACDMSTDGGGWTLVVHTGTWTCAWNKDGCGAGIPWNPWLESYGAHDVGPNKKFSMPIKTLSANASGNDLEVMMKMDGKFYMAYAGADLACAFNQTATKDCTATNNWRFKGTPTANWTQCTTQTHAQSQWWGWTWTFNDHSGKGNCAYDANGTLLHDSNCVYNGSKGHSCYKSHKTFDIWVR